MTQYYCRASSVTEAQHAVIATTFAMSIRVLSLDLRPAGAQLELSASTG